MPHITFRIPCPVLCAQSYVLVACVPRVLHHNPRKYTHPRPSRIGIRRATDTRVRKCRRGLGLGLALHVDSARLTECVILPRKTRCCQPVAHCVQLSLEIGVHAALDPRRHNRGGRRVPLLYDHTLRHTHNLAQVNDRTVTGVQYLELLYSGNQVRAAAKHLCHTISRRCLHRDTHVDRLWHVLVTKKYSKLSLPVNKHTHTHTHTHHSGQRKNLNVMHRSARSSSLRLRLTVSCRKAQT